MRLRKTISRILNGENSCARSDEGVLTSKTASYGSMSYRMLPASLEMLIPGAEGRQVSLPARARIRAAALKTARCSLTNQPGRWPDRMLQPEKRKSRLAEGGSSFPDLSCSYAAFLRKANRPASTSRLVPKSSTLPGSGTPPTPPVETLPLPASERMSPDGSVSTILRPKVPVKTL